MSGGFVPVYVQRSSPLHAARAGVTAALCAAFALVCALFEHPAVLLAVLVGVMAASTAAGVGRQLLRSARMGIPLAILIAVINPLVYQEGETLLVRGGEFLGRRFDVTLEALAAGGLTGFRVITFLMAFALFSACVDPDEMLRLFRRVSYRSALTAARPHRRRRRRRARARRRSAIWPGPRIAMAVSAERAGSSRASCSRAGRRWVWRRRAATHATSHGHVAVRSPPTCGARVRSRIPASWSARSWC